MGIVEIKTWRIKCDRCELAITVHTRFCPTIPDNWSQLAVHNCGSTGYTRYDILCPVCTAEYAASKEYKQ